jgi:hypothetical protein
VGNEGHHLIVTDQTNPGNPALCLSLSGCGPFAENGTRTALGSNYGPVTAQTSIGNSDFNALEVNFRYALGKRLTLLAGYTYAKSIDDASNLGEQINPFNMALTRVISSWDITHNMVISYTYALPRGWSLSGTTRFSTGFPVTLSDVSDNSLLGTLGNGINNQLLDTPEIKSGALQLNTNPRNGQPVFNAGLFSEEALGQLGNSARRFFHGPGIENFDMQIGKNLRLTESKSLEIRAEAFNVFNHAQFFGPASVNGVVEDSNFGSLVSAAAPRLMQVAAKFHF